jgi:hypothetical protein
MYVRWLQHAGCLPESDTLADHHFYSYLYQNTYSYSHRNRHQHTHRYPYSLSDEYTSTHLAAGLYALIDALAYDRLAHGRCFTAG